MTSSSRDLVRSTDLPEHESIRLLTVATGIDRTTLIIGTEIDERGRTTFQRLVERRRNGEPLQYLEGELPFGPVSLTVDDRALIPRPETEELFELATAESVDPKTIVDLCTGSGNLAVALAVSFPRATVVATDISDRSLSLARENAERNGASVDFRLGDLFSPLDAALRSSVDLLVANPPYLSNDEYGAVQTELTWEPRTALVAGPRGDEVIRRIADEAVEWLAPGGVMVCEIGSAQTGDAVSAFGALDHRVARDLAGRDRFVIARRRVE